MIPTPTFLRLTEVVAAACPITALSVGTFGQSGTVAFTPTGAATSPQITAAQNAINAFDWSQSADDAWLASKSGNPVLRHAMKRLAGNVQTSSNALGDVTGLSFELRPNTHYAFSFVGAYSAAAGTTGLSLAVNGPASPALVRLVACIAESGTASRNGTAGAYNAAVTGANSGGATALPFWVEGNISTGPNGGTFVLRFASEVNGSQVTILSGSMAELKEIGA